MVVESLTRPYPVRAPMVVLVVLVRFYIFIAQLMPGRTLHVPEIAFDRLLPLQPGWALVYGSLYLFLIVVPVFLVRQDETSAAPCSLTSWCGTDTDEVSTSQFVHEPLSLERFLPRTPHDFSKCSE